MDGTLNPESRHVVSVPVGCSSCCSVGDPHRASVVLLTEGKQ